MTRYQQLLRGVAVAIFIGGLTLPALSTPWGESPRSNSGERAAPPPTLAPELNELPRYFAALREWFGHHFGLRRALVALYGNVMVGALGESASPRVAIGTGGWRFLTDEGEAACSRHTQPMSHDELEFWRKQLEARQKILGALGIPYVFMVVPDKHTIYADKLPLSMRAVAGKARLDQLIDHLRATSHFRVLDIRAALIQAREAHDVYLRGDTHWNDHGAFVGYQQLAKALQTYLPQLEPRRLSDYDAVPARQVLDLDRYLGLTEASAETFLELRPKAPRPFTLVDDMSRTLRATDTGRNVQRAISRNPQAALPRAMIFCDSMMTRMMPFLAEHFREITFLRTAVLDPYQVRDYMPVVVIQEVTERGLMAWQSPTAVAAPPTADTRAY